MRLNDIVKQLKQEQDRLEKQLVQVNEAISAFVGTNGGPARKAVSTSKGENCSRTAKTLGEG